MLGSRTVARAVVFGAGYVLGARAGRERYEEIRQWSKETGERLRDQYALARAESAGIDPSDGSSSAAANGDLDLRDHADLADIRLGRD